MFEVIILIAISIYFLMTVIFLLGIKRRFPKISIDKLPTATVIVAARNEEGNILRCLQSLEALEYPEGKLDVIIVDDKSTDKTASIIEKFIEGKPQFQKLTSQKEIGWLKGKTNALANALEIAKGEIILTTDADCAVSPTWAKTIASYYTDGVAGVNGFTCQEFTTPFKGMQNLDFLYLLTVGSGTINIDMPLSCIGNNMSYLKKAYDEVGGYQNLPFSVTEDFNLLMAIHALKKYRIIFPLDKDALVRSLACPDYKSLFRQKKRWVVGGLKVPLYGYFLLFAGLFAHLTIALSPFFFSSGVGALVFFKILLDFFLLYRVTSELGIKKSMKYFWTFQIYYLLYVLLVPLIVAPNRQVIWKDRTY